MLLGLLLAKQGIQVTVLESHKDFEREYRGEVLMPRFGQMMQQIGLWKHLLSYQHLQLKNFELFFRDKLIIKISLSDLSPEVPFALWMPQPIMLKAFLDKAKTYPNFHMLFGTLARDLIEDNGKVVGLVAEHEGQSFEVRAAVTVGADGRSSIVRKGGRFEFEYEHYDFDLVWFTVKHALDYENTVRAFFSSQYRYLVLPKYPDLVQCGIVVRKGEFSEWRKKGIHATRQELLDGHPIMHEFARELKDFSSFSVLQARVSYVKQWAKDGCMLIGDAAHTCSPAGAIGVSVAAGTAIVAADVLTEAFAKKDFSKELLGAVQAKRGEEVKRIQGLQARFTSVAFLKYPFLQWLTPYSLAVFAKTGIMRRFQRQLMVMEQPLPCDHVRPFSD